MKTRISSIAGAFYSNNANDLSEELSYVNNFKDVKKYFAVIVPHAGYVYSGKVAGEAYKRISPDYSKVIILAPNHTVYTKKAVLDSNDFWATPLGNVKLWKPKIVSDAFVENGVVHKQEHSAEVHVPFLQAKLKNFEILPIVVGDVNEVDLNKVSKEIIRLMDENTLLVISTDLSHFLTDREAREVDEETISSILSLKDVSSVNACGVNPLKVANRVFKELNKKPEFLVYANSGDVTGSKNEVVGYASFVVP